MKKAFIDGIKDPTTPKPRYMTEPIAGFPSINETPESFMKLPRDHGSTIQAGVEAGRARRRAAEKAEADRKTAKIVKVAAIGTVGILASVGALELANKAVDGNNNARISADKDSTVTMNDALNPLPENPADLTVTVEQPVEADPNDSPR